MGTIPANAVLPARDPNIPAWATFSPDQRRLYARFMEVYAGYLAFTDHEIGRLVDRLKQTGQYDNTLFVVVVGDNGASKEGTPSGDVDRSPAAKPMGLAEGLAYNLERIGEIGTAKGNETNYPLGWAQAANTPFRLWKSDANSEGGTRNPLILSWPRGIPAGGAVRGQYGHVIDLLPTTLELAGLKAPARIGGTAQQPIEGISLAYSVRNAQAPSQHRVQYYYIFGARAIYRDGWKATLPYPVRLIPTGAGPDLPFDENAWELYNLDADPTERVNLARREPARLAEMRSLFESEARAHNLYPLITWDDVRKGRIHRAPGAAEAPGALEKFTETNRPKD